MPALWSFFVRLGVFLVLEGACARLAERNGLTARTSGPDLLLGLLAVIAVPLWPAAAALGARAVLAQPDRWRAGPALFRSGRACLAVAPYLGAPLVALIAAAPWQAGRLAGLALAWLVTAAALGCLLARGAAPWGQEGATRRVTRAGLLFTLVAVVILRAWQPEASIVPLFEHASALHFPFEKKAPAAPRPPPPPKPRHPVPPVAPDDRAVGALLVMASVTLLAVGVTWRRPPALPAVSPDGEEDLWAVLVPFAGALALLVLDVALLPPLTPRPRAYTIAVAETFVLAALGLALPQLARVCGPGRDAFRTAAGAVVCLAAAAVLGLEEVWVHHLPTTLAVLFSVLAFGAIGGAAAPVLGERADPELGWSLWLGVGSLLVAVLVLTDALYLKIELHEVRWVWQVFILCWLVTKTTITVLILFAAALLPDWR